MKPGQTAVVHTGTAAVSTVARAVDALIGEARDRARRRRWRNGLVAVAAILSFALVVTQRSLPGGSTDHAPVRSNPGRPGSEIAGAANGQLTIMASEDSNDGSIPNWYGLAAIGADGRLDPVARCPDRVRWCGDVMSADWSPRGDRLAIAVTSS